MHRQSSPPREPVWLPDEMEIEGMTEDDFELSDADELEDDVEALADEDVVREPAGNVPVWRLIEMSRENRFLERELADFEDYEFWDDRAGSDAWRHVH